MSVSYEKARVVRLLQMATKLGFADDISHWQRELDQIEAREKQGS